MEAKLLKAASPSVILPQGSKISKPSSYFTSKTNHCSSCRFPSLKNRVIQSIHVSPTPLRFKHTQSPLLPICMIWFFLFSNPSWVCGIYYAFEFIFFSLLDWASDWFLMVWSGAYTGVRSCYAICFQLFDSVSYFLNIALICVYIHMFPFFNCSNWEADSPYICLVQYIWGNIFLHC